MRAAVGEGSAPLSRSARTSSTAPPASIASVRAAMRARSSARGHDTTATTRRPRACRLPTAGPRSGARLAPALGELERAHDAPPVVGVQALRRARVAARQLGERRRRRRARRRTRSQRARSRGRHRRRQREVGRAPRAGRGPCRRRRAAVAPRSAIASMAACASGACDADRARLGQRQVADQVVRHARALGGARLVGERLDAGVDLHRVDADDLAGARAARARGRAPTCPTRSRRRSRRPSAQTASGDALARRRAASARSRPRCARARARPARAPVSSTVLFVRVRPRRTLGSVRDGPSTSTSCSVPEQLPGCARGRGAGRPRRAARSARA